MDHRLFFFLATRLSLIFLISVGAHHLVLLGTAKEKEGRHAIRPLAKAQAHLINDKYENRVRFTLQISLLHTPGILYADRGQASYTMSNLPTIRSPESAIKFGVSSPRERDGIVPCDLDRVFQPGHSHLLSLLVASQLDHLDYCLDLASVEFQAASSSSSHVDYFRSWRWPVHPEVMYSIQLTRDFLSSIDDDNHPTL